MRGIKFENHRKRTMKAGKYTFSLGDRTLVMGILNITPDSFSDGGDFFDLEKAVKHAQEMVLQGADIIDIGGESTRPGSMEVSAEEEMRRVLPVLERLVQEIHVPISVDTSKALVAREALRLGAHIINDVWGMQRDRQMASVIAEYDIPVVVMHNQVGTEYKRDIMEDICAFLVRSVEIGVEAGIKPGNIILDPGIGFGKTPEQNIEVLSRLGELNDLGFPILLGTSRKSVIGKVLDTTPKERLEGTIATTVMGIIQGVDIIRVHDVLENYRAAKMTDAVVRRR